MDKQKVNRVKDYILTYQRKQGLSPSYRKIMKDLKFNNIAAVQRIVNALEKMGDIKKTRLGGIDLPPFLRIGKMINAPLVGTVPCGEPSIPLEDIEGSYSLPAELFGLNEKFILKAKGDSMIESGIHPGDLLIVEKREEARNGEIVVAMIDRFGESEATTKRYFKETNLIRLHPENSSMKDMYFDFDEVKICGIVVGVMRSYK